MTSKEFVRCCNAFASLDRAAKYFKGFLSRLSKFQTEVIQHDICFTNLFNYLLNEKK